MGNCIYYQGIFGESCIYSDYELIGDEMEDFEEEKRKKLECFHTPKNYMNVEIPEYEAKFNALFYNEEYRNKREHEKFLDFLALEDEVKC